MAIIARFSFDVPFGKKEELFRLEAKHRELQSKAGFPKAETLVGSIGAAESRVESNYRFENLAALEAAFAKLAQGAAAWPSSSARWPHTSSPARTAGKSCACASSGARTM